jgi:filamentous hemagglutinin family protein
LAGHADFVQNGKEIQIIASDSVWIDWSDFSIEEGESTLFIQPDSQSVGINRAFESPSRIFGRLHSNGQILLINPQGILFGEKAQINAGSLIASTFDLQREAFSNGKLILVV